MGGTEHALSTDRPLGSGGLGSAGATVEVGSRSPAHRLRLDVINLAWPVVIEQLLATSVGIADVAIAGRLSPSALAGAGVGLQILFIAINGLSAFSIGTTVAVAQSVGARRPAMAGNAMRQGVSLGILCSVAVALPALLFTVPLIALGGGTGEVAIAGEQFLSVALLGIVPLTVQLTIGGAMRGAGDSRTPMVAGALVNAVNIAAAYALAFGAWGAPNLGIAGAAWGANIARIVGLVFLFAVLFRRAAPEGIRLGRHAPAGTTGWLPDLSMARLFVRLSLPPVIEQLSFALMFLLFGRILLALGPLVFAGQRITFSTGSVTWLPAIGLGTATTALVGQAVGAGDHDRVGEITKFSLVLGFTWMVASAILVAIFAPTVASFFTTDQALIAIAAGGLYGFVPCMPVFAINVMIWGALRGTGDTRFPMWVGIATTWCVSLPASWCFSTYLGWGLMGACGGFLAGLVVSTTCAVWRYRQRRWTTQSGVPVLGVEGFVSAH